MVESFMTQTPISKRVKHFPWQHNFYNTVLVRACPFRFATTASIRICQTVSPTDLPIYDSHRNYEIMQIINIFAKQVFSPRLAKQIRYRAWPNIFDNPAHHTFVSDTLIYNCFIDAVMLGSFEILQNANTWHFSPLFLMYIFGA